jgi:hypothetical protein
LGHISVSVGVREAKLFWEAELFWEAKLGVEVL